MKTRFALWISAVLAAVLAVAQPMAALAGAMSVDSGMPVFIPPLLFPANQTASGVAGASGAAAADAFATPQQAGAAKPAKPGATTDSATRAITDGLRDGARFCASLAQAEYRVDCLSERLAAVAQAIPQQGDYAEARAVLEQTAAQLAELARANRSADLPPGRAHRGGTSPLTTTRPLTPVATAALTGVNQQATAILEEAETLLLRSTSLSDDRHLAYIQIAAALGSGKLLLRSA